MRAVSAECANQLSEIRISTGSYSGAGNNTDLELAGLPPGIRILSMDGLQGGVHLDGKNLTRIFSITSSVGIVLEGRAYFPHFITWLRSHLRKRTG